MSSFIDQIKKEYIINFFRKKILTKLHIEEFTDVIDFLIKTINYIGFRFCFDVTNSDIYWNQLIQNNYRDLIAIFNLLFPYIDDKEGTYELHKQIEYLSDISLKKNPHMSQNDLNDVSKNSYLISNIQYSLYKTITDGLYKYDNVAISHNYNLLLSTIDRISNKLFVNWLNIRPLLINNYKESYLYKNSFILYVDEANLETYEISVPKTKIKLNIKQKKKKKKRFTIKKFDAKKIELGDCMTYYTLPQIIDKDKNESDLQNFTNVYLNESPTEINHYNKGISVGDVFNTIYNDLFYDIYKIKWLIFQGTFADNEHDQIYIEIFNELIAVPELYLGIKWNEMDINMQNKFIKKWDGFLNLIMMQDNDHNIVNHYIKMLEKIIVSCTVTIFS